VILQILFTKIEINQLGAAYISIILLISKYCCSLVVKVLTYKNGEAAGSIHVGAIL
jgi:hypothetical protein